MGLLLTDIYSPLQVALRGVSGNMVIGGAGVFDAAVIGGILALLIAEVFGEARERIQGGPAGDRPQSLRQGLADAEISEELDQNEIKKSKGDEEGFQGEE